MSDIPQSPQRRHEILVVSHYFDQHGGGIERTARRLIDELSLDAEWHFSWAASHVQEEAKERDDQRKEETLLPMACSNLLERLSGMPWPIWKPKSLKKLKAAILRADVIWMHDALYMGNIYTYLVARRAKKPIVITQHIGTVPYRNLIPRYLMRLADRLFTRPILKRVDQVIFVSDRVAEVYNRTIAFQTPVMVIPNGVDADIFYPVDAEQRRALRAQFALRDDQPVIMFSGRFIQKKGLAVIKRLTELLPTWRFWLAGHGPINPESWFGTNVHVFKGRQGASLAELYRTADLFVLPSYGEGFPLVIQEAMACGLPVVCSPVTAAGSLLAKPFLLTAAVNPSAPLETAAIWAKRLHAQKDYLPLPECNQDLAAAAHYFWSWPKIAACYADIFRDVLKKKTLPKRR